MANAIFITHNKSSLIVAPRTFHKCQSSNVDNVRISFGSNIKFNGSRVPQQNLLPLRRNMKLWVVGTIFTIVMSFSKGKWGPLLLLKEKVETTIEEAERIADVIEEVAERVDKAAEEVVKIIPEGKLRDAVEFVEKVAENVDKIAENAGDTLEKVDDMEDELDSLLKSLPKQQINAVTTTESKDQK
ncbi:uncharacterized protein LOC107610044 [Arachis ipaensis]|uniref:uncharacterized protein LOC107610044 n=1 Tax=Arachis ipaensis TaxID=130454 RepID=UPI000A2B2DED|nr:uncharacterized protein LOC107610044 [Arachis ipaensis]XP_029150566.1 uncharacterized protein LOC112766617 isoform X2 [Arachis hypogaea]